MWDPCTRSGDHHCTTHGSFSSRYYCCKQCWSLSPVLRWTNKFTRHDLNPRIPHLPGGKVRLIYNKVLGFNGSFMLHSSNVGEIPLSNTKWVGAMHLFRGSIDLVPSRGGHLVQRSYRHQWRGCFCVHLEERCHVFLFVFTGVGGVLRFPWHLVRGIDRSRCGKSSRVFCCCLVLFPLLSFQKVVI